MRLLYRISRTLNCVSRFGLRRGLEFPLHDNVHTERPELATRVAPKRRYHALLSDRKSFSQDGLAALEVSCPTFDMMLRAGCQLVFAKKA
jgi:hypothetical protein